MNYAALSREEVKAAIDGKLPRKSRVPMLIHFWIHADEFGVNRPAVLELMRKFPYDVQRMQVKMPEMFDGCADAPEYRWMNMDDPYRGKAVGIDERIAITEWSQLDEVFSAWPDHNYLNMFPDNPAPNGTYRVATFWQSYFERLWSFRGMTNSLIDLHCESRSVHRLFEKLTDFYLVVMERAKKELNIDGIFTSDDIGMQTAPFFSLKVFRELFKPYYSALISKAHQLGIHFWLHTCGNVELFMEDYVDMKLDVIHPIQKYCMNEKTIADRYGNDICIWAGFDVQQTIPWGTTEQVRAEVRHMLDTYYKPNGRLIFGPGNGINGDCPLPSLDALFEEAFQYSTKIAL